MRFTNCTIALLLSAVLSASPILAVGSAEKAPRISAPRSNWVSPPVKTKRMPSRRLQNPVPLEGQTATSLPDGRVLLVGGLRDDGPSAAVDLVNPASGQSKPFPALRHARAWHTSTMLPDGRVLVFGGLGSDRRVVNVAELVDPATGATEELVHTSLTARAKHTATLLTDGRVLIVGGVSDKNRLVSKTQIWDLQSRTVASAAPLSIARQGHDATLLADGNVLIAGGSDLDNNQITSAELFNVEAQTLSFTSIAGQDDGQAPFLAGSLPAAGANNVPVQSVIALRFSKQVAVEAIKPATIKLQGPNDVVAVSIVPAERGRLAFVSPLEPLLKGALYTLSISNPKDGSAGVTPTSISFTTANDNPEPRFPNDLDWTPDADSLRGNWRSKFERSKWQDEPPLQAGQGETALAGQVLTVTGQPLRNVTISVKENSTRTDQSGRFLLPGTAGHQVMLIDGRSASRPGAAYGIFRAGVDITAGKTNVLPYTIWMPKLDIANAVSIPSPNGKDLVITNPRIPGLELHLPAGTVIRDLDGRSVTQLTITPIPTDRTPFPLPSDLKVPVFASIQPGGARVIPPRAKLIYPNYTASRPGTRIDFWTYDPEEKGWYVYGQGTVTPNGKQIVPDAGVVIYEFSGIMIGNESTKVPDKSGSGSRGGGTCGMTGLGCGGGGNNGTPGTAGKPGANTPKGGGGGSKPAAPNGKGGEPIDLSSGLFIASDTDIYLPDTLPISIIRTYRTLDTVSRAFGIGATMSYDMFLTSTNNYQQADLILPDGGKIHYTRISPGTGFTDAVYEHTETPTEFYKSRLSYNGTGWDVTLTDGTVLVFPEFNPLHAIRDRYGNQITIWRETLGIAGNITQVTSPNGKWLKFTYDSSHRITQVQDNIGRTVGYTYDASGRLWKKTDPNSGVTEYTYDTSHRLLTIKAPKGNVFLTNEYDANGRVSEQTLADSSTFEFDYTLDGSGNVTTTEVTDPRGNVRSVSFNASQHQTSATYGVGTSEEQTFTYNRDSGSGIINSIVDSLGRETTYTRDADGFITEITMLEGTADEVSVHYTYEPNFHFLATVTDPLNHTTSFTYDNLGNPLTTTDPLNHVTTFTYNANGQLTSITDPLSHVTEFIYDQGELVAVEDPLNRRVDVTFDAVGRTIRVTDPLGQGVRYEYDVLDRVTQLVDSRQGTLSFAYDANSNITSVTDPRSKVITYTYDNMDRMTNREDQLSNDTVYDHNADGTLASVTDRNGQVTSYTYDSLDRLTEVTYDDSSTTTYTYDDGNRMTEIVDSVSGTITMTYDDFDRLTEIETPQGTISYTYDDASRRASLSVPGQTTINYTYDNADRLTQITQGSSSATFTYDNANRRTSLTPPGGAKTEYTYDDASQLTELTYKYGAITLGNLTYSYDAAGRRTAVGGTYARTNLPSALTTTSYNDANQLTTFGSATLTYDLNGNLTGDGTYTYTWNARNRLASISGTGFSAAFSYDAFGRRISKTVNGTTTSYLYDGSNLVQEQSGGSATANLVTGGLDEVLARTDSTSTWNLLADGLGSTVALVNSSGSVQTEYTYEPFGKATSSGSSNANTAQYTGRENDGTGLYFYRNRYYSPTLGRFISEDPAGLSGGVNYYAYAGNSPISFSDPYGLDPKDPDGDTCDPGGAGDLAEALRKFIDIAKGNLDRVVMVAGMEGGGAIAAERMALNNLIRTTGMGALTDAERLEILSFQNTATKVTYGELPHTALTPAQRELMARKYLEAAMTPGGKYPAQGVINYQIERANCVLNGGPAPGGLVDYLRTRGFIP